MSYWAKTEPHGIAVVNIKINWYTTIYKIIHGAKQDFHVAKLS